jgi:hypothetical protein
MAKGRCVADSEMMEEHVEEYHAFKADELLLMVEEHNNLIQNGAKLDMLVDDYFGPESEPDIDGNVHRTGGMKKLNSDNWRDQKAFNKKVETQLDNGGLHAKVKLSKTQQIAIAAAITPILAASISVLLG